MNAISQEKDGGHSTGEPPVMTFLKLFTDTAGRSSLGHGELTDFVSASLGGKAAPLWMRNFRGDLDTVVFTVLPGGWVGDWHESPGPQWVVAISGRWFIETQDGRRTEMDAGVLHWGGDQGTRALEGNVGHRSGSLDDKECILLMVRFKPNAELDPSVGSAWRN